MADNFRQRLLARAEGLRQLRDEYLDEWRDSYDFVLGIQPRHLVNSSGTGTRGRRERNEFLLNERGQWALNVMASGMMAGITSPARKWFELAPPDPDLLEYEPVKEWLSIVETKMLHVFARSNFYRTMNMAYMDMGLSGIAGIGAFESFNDVIRFENYACGTYMVGSDGEGNIDRMYRDIQLTVREAATRFGLSNLSKAHQTMYRNNEWETLINILHAMEPNDQRTINSPLSKDLPYRSVYLDKDDEQAGVLMQSGFNTKAFFSPRWMVMGDDIYATMYPAFNSMGTNKSLQVEEMDKATAIEKMHNPPMVGDSALENSGVNLIAGGVTYVPNMAQMGKQGLQSVYDVNLRVGDLKEDIQIKERRIDEAFFADLFLMISNMDRAQITATEIAERKEEKLLMMGPVLERMNNELFDPMIDRSFDIMQRKGMFPPPPKELNNAKLGVEYVSVLAQAQKAVATVSMDMTAAFIQRIGETHPEALDKLDADAAIDAYAKAKGAPQAIIRPTNEAQNIRAQRAQQMAQQQQAAAMGNAVSSAKTLADTKLDEDSALDGILDNLV